MSSRISVLGKMPRRKARRFAVKTGKARFGQSRLPSLNRTSAENSVRLWTIQHAAAWEAFLKKGILRGDGRRVDREFRFAYRWMGKEMEHRVPGYSGRYPVWAWFAPKPDLRRTGFMLSGEKAVRIEFIVPAERVLLSDFYAWHVVLNRGYLALSDEQDEEWELKTARRRHKGRPVPVDPQVELEKSWERIFDLDTLAASEWWSSEPCIQATVEYVSLQDVLKVQEFTAR